MGSQPEEDLVGHQECLPLWTISCSYHMELLQEDICDLTPGIKIHITQPQSNRVFVNKRSEALKIKPLSYFLSLETTPELFGMDMGASCPSAPSWTSRLMFC